MSKLAGYKTYITAAGGVLIAAGMFLTGQDTAPQAIQLALTSLLAAFIRSGVTTEAQK